MSERSAGSSRDGCVRNTLPAAGCSDAAARLWKAGDCPPRWFQLVQ